MSEHKALDLQSLTPEEAFNPELRQQKAEWQAYVDSRHYEDDSGRLRAPNGQFASAVSFDKARKAHFDNATDTYEDLSISGLADKLAWTDIHGDTTVSGDITDVLMDKMIAFADKNDMDSDAQTNLYNRVLTLVDKKKKDYLSKPENLELTKTERDALNQQKNEGPVDQDKPEHKDDHIHQNDKGPESSEEAEPGDAKSKAEKEKALEDILLRRAPAEMAEIQAARQDVITTDSEAVNHQAETGDEAVQSETDGDTEDDKQQATKKRGSRLKGLFGRIRNWKSTVRAVNSSAEIYQNDDDEEEPNRSEPIKPKRRIIPKPSEASEETTQDDDQEKNKENGLRVGSAELAVHGDDKILVDDSLRLYGVFDGMGGPGSGDVASDVASSKIQEYFSDILRGFDDQYANEEISLDIANLNMKNAFKHAMTGIKDRAKAGDVEPEMGTTASIVRLFETSEGPKFVYGHVGDTRIYHVSGDEIEQITEDEGEGRYLFNSLSATSDAKLDQFGVRSAQKGDRIIIVSDGITGDREDQFLSDEEFKQAVNESSPSDSANRFIELSKKNDDKSVVVIDV